MKLRGKSGFTLMELLVVLIIIGVLAAIGIPTYLNQVEKARARQAVEMLGSYREAQQRHLLENETYTGTLADLDVDGPSGGRVYWTFSTTGSTTTFSILANRTSSATDWISINELGNWDGTHDGVPGN